jgi:hypothetical protein
MAAREQENFGGKDKTGGGKSVAEKGERSASDHHHEKGQTFISKAQASRVPTSHLVDKRLLTGSSFSISPLIGDLNNLYISILHQYYPKPNNSLIKNELPEILERELRPAGGFEKFQQFVFGDVDLHLFEPQFKIFEIDHLVSVYIEDFENFVDLLVEVFVFNHSELAFQDYIEMMERNSERQTSQFSASLPVCLISSIVSSKLSLICIDLRTLWSYYGEILPSITLQLATCAEVAQRCEELFVVAEFFRCEELRHKRQVGNEWQLIAYICVIMGIYVANRHSGDLKGE